MQENFELVQKGFRTLLETMSGYIYREMKRANRDGWWNDVLTTLYNYRRDLPACGDDTELMQSLDIANCLRLITWKWSDLFGNKLSPNCKTWANELMGVRNVTAHLGAKDLEQHTAERALDTMTLLCQEMDKQSAEEIRAIYQEVRSRADGKTEPSEPQIIYRTVKQPESISTVVTPDESNLLKFVGTEYVQETTLTRKVTFGGKTEVYPVYRVRLDVLYYNDQNDRISTWISQYESENGQGSLYDIDMGIYNDIIEEFISGSNPEALNKTQKNISIFGQREPGVTLADGRVVDGNRRFTCLRRLQGESEEPMYFETVLLDVDIYADKKQIKLLELAIQHGEESKVDYDIIDYAIGTFRDVELTGLLTVDEYAKTTNEPVSEVKKRIEVARIVCEFLEFLRLPEQYHVAREYQVYDLFQEVMKSLHTLDDENQLRLKNTAFMNALLKAMPDQRKFIRDIKGLVKSGSYEQFLQEQAELGQQVRELYDACEIHDKEDADQFAADHPELTKKMQDSIERALLKLRTVALKAQPSETVKKCITMLMDLDPRLFATLDEEDKEKLRTELDSLGSMITKFKRKIK